MVTIVCIKWGDKFAASHVNALYAGVLRNMEEPFDFVCLTDDGRGLVRSIEVQPIPDLGLSERGWQRGCWPKLAVFAPWLFPPFEPVLFLDLDILIQGSLAPFIDVVRKRRQLVIQREWNPDLWSFLPHGLRPDRGAQSSIFGFYPIELEYIYRDFMARRDEIVASFRNDQTYLTEVAARRSYWPPEFCVSFKRACTRYYPFNLVFRTIKQPKKAKVVVFHGKPRPWETLVREGERWGPKRRFGIGPVPWIEQYFRQADVITERLGREPCVRTLTDGSNAIRPLDTSSLQ
ncbi:glycosyltransferase family protein [Rhizobium terrae]|uniref:glycosyltransferase n=1 Tax=Rhizobium terrae TaxID=2171756 RepID=UPI000E3E0894|nr:glycosyltransferase [Rhizobium terrae]